MTCQEYVGRATGTGRRRRCLRTGRWWFAISKRWPGETSEILVCEYHRKREWADRTPLREEAA
jgi:hypothetical protein